MNKYCIILLIIVQFTTNTLGACDHLDSNKTAYKARSFEDFSKECKNLPALRSLLKINDYDDILDSVGKYTVLTGDEFEKTVNKFLGILETTSLLDEKSWLEKTNFKQIGLTNSEAFTPYVQKMVCGPKDIIALRGDMHGDIHSLIKFLLYLQTNGYTSFEDGFRIINKNFKLIFLGDYVDRGIYGAEVIYTILRLKIANPDQVILVRGNHEDSELTQTYGFDYELIKKFIKNGTKEELERVKRIFEKLKIFYNSMPLALYLGYPETEQLSNFVQCCHGGIEIGFNPKKLLDSEETIEYQLIGQLKQKTECKELKKKLDRRRDNISYRTLKRCSLDYLPKAPKTIIDDLDYKVVGLMWNDFQYEEDNFLTESFGRGIKYNKSITEAVLNLHSSKKSKLCSVLRAHQHLCTETDPLMRQMLMSNGVARMWSGNSQEKQFHPWVGMVCTLLLSPDGTPAVDELDLVFDTNIFIKPERKFEDWNIKIVNLKLYKTI